ncbi:MAG: hypothetical protein KBT22_07450 [Bacteroidales bacterium]|nr:hypothetical protein [Candidatus Scybalocola fimicaballi]
MAFFNYDGIDGWIKQCSTNLHHIVAENEFGDTIDIRSDYSRFYDYINSDPKTQEEQQKRDNALQELCETLVEDPNNWQRKASVKFYEKNATIFIGALKGWIMEYNLEDTDLFESKEDLRNWVEERLNGLLWDAGNVSLNNYNSVVREFCDFLCKYVK